MRNVQNAISVSAKDLTQDIAEAHETMGMIKAFNFVSKLLTVGTLKKLQEIKETKKYKGLSYLDQDGKVLTVGNFAEYCKACGLSDKKVWEDLTNLNTFGEEFIETSQRLGLGYREMRKLRQLPDEARAEILEADYSEATDKEDLLEKIEDLTAQHAKVKGELEAKLKRKSDDYDAQGKVLANKNEQINRLDMELAKKAKLIETQTPDQKGGALRDEVTRLAYKVEALLRAEVWAGFEALQAHTESKRIDHSQFMSGVLAEMKLALNQLEDQFNVPDTPADTLVPEWARDNSEELDFTAELERIKNGTNNE
ncbi:hypothetical protein FHQ28_08650 [Pasteurellaceae bacterium USgator11]|nr:hypothetical protein FHQ20_11615 [Pasteurellaceae bacterium USgator41]TNG98718.1 hypothetical protein FHQ24_07860 [Pasteurellaceae bacterium UScroc31]TNH00085.1 hypothetical protein FHQ28_08650 [Pasteurellaceae bacterium USgator11]